MSKAWFGPAGTADSFSAMGYKKTIQIPEYLEKMQVDAFEYQCGRGVRVNPESAAAFRAESEKHKIRLSLHAPYYISLSSVEAEKRDGSIQYILDSARAADLLGAGRIIVHTGSCAKITRREAMELAADTLKRALQRLEEENLGHITVCPETMGKINQLGTLEEVLELCSMDERLMPCIDWGHLNARTIGGMCRPEHFAAAFELMHQTLGSDRMKVFHSHFSKIEYTEKGGEKRHLTFEDKVFGPDFEPLAEQLVKWDCSPVIICESAGTQTEDAAQMKAVFEEMSRKSFG